MQYGQQKNYSLKFTLEYEKWSVGGKGGGGWCFLSGLDFHPTSDSFLCVWLCWVLIAEWALIVAVTGEWGHILQVWYMEFSLRWLLLLWSMGL